MAGWPYGREGSTGSVVRVVHRPVIRHYYDELAVEAYPWEQCWRDYRRFSFGTLVMAIASSMLVARTERGDRMFLCSVERACAQIDDLDAVALLP